jgi:hypothetical protein
MGGRDLFDHTGSFFQQGGRLLQDIPVFRNKDSFSKIAVCRSFVRYGQDEMKNVTVLK